MSSLEKAEAQGSKSLRSAVRQERSALTPSSSKVDKLALSGDAATDRYGRPVVAIDVKAEAALARKIDVRIIPVVALL